MAVAFGGREGVDQNPDPYPEGGDGSLSCRAPECLRLSAGVVVRIEVRRVRRKVALPCRRSPDIEVDVTVDYGLADIVTDRFDAGIRLGGEIKKGMIAVHIGPDIPMAIVGSPAYFRNRPMPNSPADLAEHRAINLRLPSSRTLNPWRLMRGGRETRVRLGGPLVVNTIDLIIDVALHGHGLAYLPLDTVREHLDTGGLVRALGKSTPDLPGYHLYYPDRRHASSGFTLLVHTLR